MDVNDDSGDEDEIELQVHPDTSSKKWANKATNSLSSKKHIQSEDQHLKRLIRELSSDTMRISKIKEKKGLHTS